MLQPGRQFSAGSAYRYGFNGKEQDNEVSGQGNQYDYGFRIYNPRLGRFLSVDPLMKNYPSWSSYPFAMNRPIDGLDLDGLEWIHYKIQYKMSGDGKKTMLSKTVVEDYRNKSESDLIKIHGNRKPYGSSWLSEYSQGFGTKGRGVLYTYEELDEKGNTISSEEKMELASGLTRHGFYAGTGCITKSGELITPSQYGNYDFGMMPIDMPDALAKEHDKLQDIPNHKGYMHTDYLNSDVLLLNKLRRFEKAYKNDPNYIDPFTGRKVSEEAKRFTENAIALFEVFVALKVIQLDKKLANKEITQEEYDKSMFLYRTQELAEKSPMPTPTDYLNKGSK